MFIYDEKRHRELLDDESADLELIERYSTADEFHRAISEGDETRTDGEGFISHPAGYALSVYPLSLSEPEPVLVLTAPGHPFQLMLGSVETPPRAETEGEGVSQADATTALVRGMVDQANRAVEELAGVSTRGVDWDDPESLIGVTVQYVTGERFVVRAARGDDLATGEVRGDDESRWLPLGEVSIPEPEA